MKSAIQLGQLFIVVLTISVAAIFFAGLGCHKGPKQGVVSPTEINLQEGAAGGEAAVEQEGATEGEAEGGAVEEEPAVAPPEEAAVPEEQVVYVKEGGAGDGTKENPMGDINAAIALAKSKWPTSPSEVHVAKGIYEVTSGINHIEMKEGVKVYGGYSYPDWTARDVTTNITKIKDKSSSGGYDVTYPNRTVEADGSEITSETVIDGFTIFAGGGKYSVGILTKDSAALVISNNTIHGGSGSVVSSGIHNEASSPSIIDNWIEGGSGQSACFGIMNDHGSSPKIYNNLIKAGSGTNVSYGIGNQLNSSPKIYNNIIVGGSGFTSRGISNWDNSTPEILNNTINGGNAKFQSVAIDLGDCNVDCAIPIFNNIIYTSGNAALRYGIYKSLSYNNPPQLEQLENNDLFDCPKAVYHDSHNNNDLIVCDNGTISDNCDFPTVEIGGGNVSKVPNFVGPEDLHLQANSPVEVRTGGLDGAAQNWGFTTDKDGKTRTGNGTTGWSMGAYERDIVFNKIPLYQQH
jgi:hypothetical protein